MNDALIARLVRSCLRPIAGQGLDPALLQEVTDNLTQAIEDAYRRGRDGGREGRP